MNGSVARVGETRNNKLKGGAVLCVTARLTLKFNFKVISCEDIGLVHLVKDRIESHQ